MEVVGIAPACQSFARPMNDLFSAFNEVGIRYLLAGGQAMRLYGMPRFSMVRKSVGPIPAVRGHRGEGAQAEEQETADDGQESHGNRMETAGG